MFTRPLSRSLAQRAHRKMALRLALGVACVALVVESGCSPAAVAPLVILISGDTAGWIVPCGCTSNQSGGLLRRGSYVADQAVENDVILADSGGAAGGTSEYQRWKFQAILSGEMAMGLDAHNIGAAEAALGAEYLKEVGDDTKVPFISANVRDGESKLLAPAYKIAARGGRRVMLIGVLDPKFASGELQVSDPQEAILATLSESEEEVDTVVVLAYLPEDALRTLAEALPEVDAVVGGPTGQTVPPTMVGPTLLTSATNKGKFLVHIDVAEAGSESTLSGKIVEIGEDLDDDEKQTTNLQQFYARLAERDFAADETGFAQKLPAGLPVGYGVAGTASCQKCHEDDCQQWEESTHAHAWQTLVDKASHVDPDCQRCHTTSYGLPDGFRSIATGAARQNVGCESCHGPSQAHVDNTKVRTPFVAAEQCIVCHDRENSPEFEYDEYWSQIEHGTNASGD